MRRGTLSLGAMVKRFFGLKYTAVVVVTAAAVKNAIYWALVIRI